MHSKQIKGDTYFFPQIAVKLWNSLSQGKGRINTKSNYTNLWKKFYHSYLPQRQHISLKKLLSYGLLEGSLQGMLARYHWMLALSLHCFFSPSNLRLTAARQKMLAMLSLWSQRVLADVWKKDLWNPRNKFGLFHSQMLKNKSNLLVTHLEKGSHLKR